MTVISICRRRLQITQGRLARLANVAACQISPLEKGVYRAGPSVRARIAGALGCAEAELFDADGWPTEAAMADA